MRTEVWNLLSIFITFILVANQRLIKKPYDFGLNSFTKHMIIIPDFFSLKTSDQVIGLGQEINKKEHI